MALRSWTSEYTNVQRKINGLRMHIDYKKMQEYLKGYWDRPSPEGIRKYYKGFNMINRSPMFEEELKDLEQAYRISLKDMEKEVEEVLPYLLSYMESFVTLHKKNEAMREKLDALLAKTNREEESDE